ncbi:hypothetical protein HK103_005287 [Boothiomyces macroporosus]|uniref:Cytochrome b5 heme-binding domain-containing protein n=1 Tax=Boothiomyces macroporosus TaxID=261099 RepID=A0AAD5UJ06_9FUNG|nr:hypothetical protein HK103_005287 [Boothiomyces macroporosus]
MTTERTFTPEELAKYNGLDLNLPVYLAIKGTVFDVSSARQDYYNEGKGYAVFAGKDASNALGKSSVKPEDCYADYSKLTEEEVTLFDVDESIG